MDHLLLTSMLLTLILIKDNLATTRYTDYNIIKILFTLHHQPQFNKEIWRSFVSRGQKGNNTVTLNGTHEVAKKSYVKLATRSCGRPDKIDAPYDFPADSNKIWTHPGYTLSGKRWWKTKVTWKIIKFSGKLLQEEQIHTLKKALSLWQEFVPLKLEFTTEHADINILFSAKQHGDDWEFDGQGNVLAHAFIPDRGIGGDIHFDEDEDWTLSTGQGSDLLTVAVHELGHALGLEHSDDPESVMSPYYTYRENLNLATVDIQGINAVYRKPGVKKQSNGWLREGNTNI